MANYEVFGASFLNALSDNIREIRQREAQANIQRQIEERRQREIEAQQKFQLDQIKQEQDFRTKLQQEQLRRADDIAAAKLEADRKKAEAEAIAKIAADKENLRRYEAEQKLKVAELAIKRDAEKRLKESATPSKGELSKAQQAILGSMLQTLERLELSKASDRNTSSGRARIQEQIDLINKRLLEFMQSPEKFNPGYNIVQPEQPDVIVPPAPASANKPKKKSSVFGG